MTRRGSGALAFYRRPTGRPQLRRSSWRGDVIARASSITNGPRRPPPPVARTREGSSTVRVVPRCTTTGQSRRSRVCHRPDATIDRVRPLRSSRAATTLHTHRELPGRPHVRIGHVRRHPAFETTRRRSWGAHDRRSSNMAACSAPARRGGARGTPRREHAKAAGDVRHDRLTRRSTRSSAALDTQSLKRHGATS